MTREECIKKLEALEVEYLHDRKQFTIDLFDGPILNICLMCYTCNEEEDLGALSYYCDTILEVMKPEILDNFILSRVKYIIEKRLKTIRNERR